MFLLRSSIAPGLSAKTVSGLVHSVNLIRTAFRAFHFDAPLAGTERNFKNMLTGFALELSHGSFGHYKITSFHTNRFTAD